MEAYFAARSMDLDSVSVHRGTDDEFTPGLLRSSSTLSRYAQSGNLFPVSPENPNLIGV